MYRGILSFSLLLLTACSQDIQVIEDCAVHDVGSSDGGHETDSGRPTDAGVDDGGVVPDTGLPDSGVSVFV